MRSIRAWLLRFGGLLGGAAKDDELAAELESHLQLHIDDNIRAGMTPEAARRDALIRLGGLEATKERYRDRRGLPALDALWLDLRHAVRALARRPLLLAATTLSIGIGAGINVSVYSVLQRVLFEDIITADALIASSGSRPGSRISTSGSADAGAPVDLATMTMAALADQRRDDDGQRARRQRQLIDVVGVRAAIGRTFQSGDADPAVISFGFWQQRFGGDPAALGRTIELNGWPYVIVGVLPRDFRSQAIVSPGVYVPTGRHVSSALDNRRAAYFDLIGRLHDGVTREQATAALRIARKSSTRVPAANTVAERALTAIPPTRSASSTSSCWPIWPAASSPRLHARRIAADRVRQRRGPSRGASRRAPPRDRGADRPRRVGARVAQQFLAESLVIGARMRQRRRSGCGAPR
jgi:hypothetical protein